MQIAIVSGKGGTGKTTIATSIALILQNVHLIDADVEEPNCSLFLNIKVNPIAKAELPVPEIDEEKCTLCGICSDSCEYNALANLPGQILLFDKICHGCGVCSAVCPEDAITEKYRQIGTIFEGRNKEILFHYGELIVGEELSTPIIGKLKDYVQNEDEIVIFDAPPGSACPMVETVIDSDYVIIVSEPTPFGFSDMKIVVKTLLKLEKKFGVIINKEGIGNNDLENFCNENDIPILMKIPFNLDIARQYSKGIPLVSAVPNLKENLVQMVMNIKEVVKNE